MTENSQVRLEEPKKPRVILRRFIVILVGLACIYALWRVLADKPAILVQTDDVNAPVNVKTREVPDFRYLYNARQERGISPVDQNGWQTLLASFGPAVLQQAALANSIAWEEFPTHEASKEWYETQWTTICEKMGVDPAARPTFYQRLNMFDTLIKYGVTGQEGAQRTNQDSVAQKDGESTDSDELGFYYEDCQKHTGVISVQEAEDAYTDFQRRPWTEQDSPVLAKWLEENEDQYQVIATAARQPHMLCWRITPEFPHTVFETLLPDVQSLRSTFARMVLIRANYRIGTGDLAAAMDDFETLLALSNSSLRSESAFLVEILSGLAIVSDALGVALHHNADAPFDPELSARYIALVRQYASDEMFNDAFESAIALDHAMSASVVCDLLRARRSPSCSVLNMIKEIEPLDEIPSAIYSNFSFLAPLNDARVLQRYQTLMTALESGASSIEAAAMSGQKVDRKSEEFLKSFVTLFEPAYDSLNLAKNARLVETRLAIITEALLAYQGEHGTLPPAFSVDADGKPLHSWRVLILPYLGEQERALYDQIHLDEPWDSEYNREFFARMPSVYRGSTSPDMPPDVTPFTVLLGEDQFFDASGVGKDWRSMMKREDRNTAVQGILFERKKSICWMQPDAELQVADLVANFPEKDENYVTTLDRPVGSIGESLGDVLREHRGGFQFGRAVGGEAFISANGAYQVYDEMLRGRPQTNEE
ncbi:MAG: DUF1559 domain-containing protein [Planctomycetia bacterium]|nr:DUF1559 domain-containing protein [Planctomycetia bacterium]